MDSSLTVLDEKTLAKLIYLDKTSMKAFSTNNQAIWAIQKRWIFISGPPLEFISIATYITKASSLLFKAMTTNSPLLLNSTLLIVGRVSAAM